VRIRPSHRTGNRDAALALLAAGRGVDRRQFIKGIGAGGLLMIGGPALLAACSDDAGCEFTSTGTGNNTTLQFANWPFYIDQVEDGWFETSSLEDFEEATGISINYLEEVNDNHEWFGKVQAQLAACANIQRDLTVLTDWMAARFIRLEWALELDHSKIANRGNLVDALQSPSFDPERTYTMPWQSGMTAIGYNPELTGGELSSINDIFDPSLSGRVAMLTESRDTLGLVMLGMDIDPSECTMDEINAAIAKIQPYVDNGHIRRFTGNEYGDDLVAGNLAACFAWSGDVVQLQLDNPELQFLFPEEGLMLWSDNMLIPQGAANVDAAHEYMSYVYDPTVAAKIASWVNFIPPVEGTRDALLGLAEEIEDDELAELADDPLIFPDEATLAKSHIFRGLTEEEERQLDDAFQALIGA
jgi:spermidine/putrescine transport system substrate-binding protein